MARGAGSITIIAGIVTGAVTGIAMMIGGIIGVTIAVTNIAMITVTIGAETAE